MAEDDDIKLETRFSSKRNIFPYLVGGLAVVVVAVFVGLVVSGKAKGMFPVLDQFLETPIPTAPDGSEPLSLQALKQSSDDKSLSVEGTIVNRTTSTLSGLLAVIEVKDGYTLVYKTVEVPVEPVELKTRETGAFQASVPLGEHGLGGYSIQFKLPGEDGPHVRHKDDRPAEPEKPSEQSSKSAPKKSKIE